MRCDIGHMEQLGGSPAGGLGAAVVARGGGRAGVAGQLLHDREVAAGVEEVAGPGPAQIVGREWLGGGSRASSRQRSRAAWALRARSSMRPPLRTGSSSSGAGPRTASQSRTAGSAEGGSQQTRSIDISYLSKPNGPAGPGPKAYPPSDTVRRL